VIQVQGTNLCRMAYGPGHTVMQVLPFTENKAQLTYVVVQLPRMLVEVAIIVWTFAFEPGGKMPCEYLLLTITKLYVRASVPF
jgi:hypothetical protein